MEHKVEYSDRYKKITWAQWKEVALLIKDSGSNHGGGGFLAGLYHLDRSEGIGGEGALTGREWYMGDAMEARAH